MVQITAVALFSLLLAPSLAVPISNGQELDARPEELTERNWFKSLVRRVKNIATPANIGTVAGLVIRDDESQITERDIEELSDREFAELMERKWFKFKPTRGVTKIATRDLEELTERKWFKFKPTRGVTKIATRDLEELTERDIEDLIQRGWFKSFVHKVATPANIRKVASLVLREDAEDLSQRDMEYLEDLSTREPSVKSFIRKVKDFIRPSNVNKAARTVKAIHRLLRREDADGLAERDVAFEEEELSARELEDLEDLAARDPTFGSIFRNLVSREDGDVFQRDYGLEDLD
jgi:hypothetical protein